MRKIWLLMAAAALIAGLSPIGAVTGVLDHTSWKIQVEPEQMAKDAGAMEFSETFTFGNGRVSLSELGKAGFPSSPYTVTNIGGDNWTLSAEQRSRTRGTAVWVGEVHGNDVRGRLTWTQPDGRLFAYSFHGEKER